MAKKDEPKTSALGSVGRDAAANALKTTGGAVGVANQAMADDAAAKTQRQTQGPGTGQAPSATAQGMFGFQQMMDDYYKWDPAKEKDDEGVAQKRAFQQEMIQSAFDTQSAAAKAAQANEFELDVAKQYANLELRNQGQIMQDNFNYGVTEMGLEYDLQSRFAVDEAARELTRMGAAGDIQQEQTKLEGKENRLNLGEQGRQDRLTIDAKADADIKSRGGTEMERDAQAQQAAMAQLRQAGVNEQTLQGLINDGALANITAQGVIYKYIQTLLGDNAIKQINAQGGVDLSKITQSATDAIRQSLGVVGGTQREAQKDVLTSQENQIGLAADADIKRMGGTEKDLIGARGSEDRSTIQTQGTEQRSTIQTQGAEDRSTIQTKGTEDRSTIQTSGTEQRATDTNRITTQGTEDRSTIQTKGTEDRAGMVTMGDQDIRRYESKGGQDRLNIQAQGRDNRETMREADRLEAGKQNRAAARSRALARR